MKKIVFLAVLMIAVLCAANAMASDIAVETIYDGDVARTFIFYEYQNDSLTPITLTNVEIKLVDQSNEEILKAMAPSMWPRVINPGKSGYIAFELVRPATEVKPSAGIHVNYQKTEASQQTELYTKYNWSLATPMYVYNEKAQAYEMGGPSYIRIEDYMGSWRMPSAVVVVRDQNNKLMYVGYNCSMTYGAEKSVEYPINPKLYERWREKGMTNLDVEVFGFVE